LFAGSNFDLDIRSGNGIKNNIMFSAPKNIVNNSKTEKGLSGRPLMVMSSGESDPQVFVDCNWWWNSWWAS